MKIEKKKKYKEIVKKLKRRYSSNIKYDILVIQFCNIEGRMLQ